VGREDRMDDVESMGGVKWREVDWRESSYSQTKSGACGGDMVAWWEGSA